VCWPALLMLVPVLVPAWLVVVGTEKSGCASARSGRRGAGRGENFSQKVERAREPQPSLSLNTATRVPRSSRADSEFGRGRLTLSPSQILSPARARALGEAQGERPRALYAPSALAPRAMAAR